MIAQFELDQGRSYNGSYLAVGAALIEDLSLGLKCLLYWPSTAKEIVQETNVKLHRTALLRQLSERSEVVSVIVQTAELLVPRSEIVPINIHVCGPEGGGKSTSVQTLKDTMPRMWRSSMVSRSLSGASFRQLQNFLSSPNISEAFDTLDFCGVRETFCVDLPEGSRRAILHDHSSQKNAMKVALPYLRSINAIYLLVLPLWSHALGKFTDLSDLCKACEEWLKLIATIAADPQLEFKPKVIIAINDNAPWSDDLPESDPRGPFMRWISEVQSGRFSCVQLIGDPVTVNMSITKSVFDKLIPLLRDVFGTITSDAVPLCALTDLIFKMDSNELPGYGDDYEMLQALVSYLRRNRIFKEGGSGGEKALFSLAQLSLQYLTCRGDVLFIPGKNVNYYVSNPNWLTDRFYSILFSTDSLATTSPVDSFSSSPYDWHKFQEIFKKALKKEDNRDIRAFLNLLAIAVPIAGKDGLETSTWNSKVSSLLFPMFTHIAMESRLLDADCTEALANQYEIVDKLAYVYPPGALFNLLVAVGSSFRVELMTFTSNGMTGVIYGDELRSSAAQLTIFHDFSDDTVSVVVSQRDNGLNLRDMLGSLHELVMESWLNFAPLKVRTFNPKDELGAARPGMMQLNSRKLINISKRLLNVF